MPPKGKKRKAEKEPEVEKNPKESKVEPSNDEEIKVKKALFENPDTARNYWLMKSEPKTRVIKNVDVSFSIQDLMKEEDQTAEWDGVRNNESRNNLKGMKVGDLAFFYHSNCREPGVVGIMEIVKSAFPDESQYDVDSPFYDANSTKRDPKWYSVEVKFVRMFDEQISFSELKKHQAELTGMALFNKMRLSVQPLSKHHFDYILQLDLDNQPST